MITTDDIGKRYKLKPAKDCTKAELAAAKVTEAQAKKQPNLLVGVYVTVPLAEREIMAAEQNEALAYEDSAQKLRDQVDNQIDHALEHKALLEFIRQLWNATIGANDAEKSLEDMKDIIADWEANGYPKPKPKLPSGGLLP